MGRYRTIKVHEGDDPDEGAPGKRLGHATVTYYDGEEITAGFRVPVATRETMILRRACSSAMGAIDWVLRSSGKYEAPIVAWHVDPVWCTDMSRNGPVDQFVRFDVSVTLLLPSAVDED